jgi:hypothetical protein
LPDRLGCKYTRNKKSAAKTSKAKVKKQKKHCFAGSFARLCAASAVVSWYCQYLNVMLRANSELNYEIGLFFWTNDRVAVKPHRGAELPLTETN